MRFGLILPSFSYARDYATVGRLRDFAIRAEAMGFEGLWVAEHLLTARALYGTAWLSPLETLAFVAGCTSRIKVGTSILIPPIRNPVFLAKEIASLHMLSGGRYEFGVGVGWDAHEFEVAGVKLSERGGRTDEILDILAKLWTGEEVTHHGRYYDFERVIIDPPLPTMPRLWVAGGSKIKTDLSPDPETIAPSVLERICQRADGWIARAAGTNASVIADWAQITRRLDEIGRPPGSVTFAHVNMTYVVPTGDEAAALKEQRPRIERIMGAHRSFDHLRTCYLLGTPAQIRDRIGELADAGLEYLMLAPLDYDLGQLDLWEAELLPHFR
ncbi:MAG TPA: TIGR03619 family F420-dependent LLM class oxidoreductase [Stellaceae bacterium]|jgi:probable F420-dependent oxidoreductase|nr:TIGR03619 family F420-dependent LLM class oxidoreductase [Stellaceae bacterium]